MAERPQNRHLRPRPQWKPGETGNPKGRPPGIPRKISDCLKLALQVPDSRGRTPADKIAAVLIDAAFDGDLKAIDMVADRTEGKATQSVELTGADGGPLEFADARSRLLGRLARKPRGDPADSQ